jgi:hypothetical protein
MRRRSTGAGAVLAAGLAARVAAMNARTFDRNRTFLIPAELRERPQWVCWRYEKRGDKFTKPPIDARNGRAAHDNPATWTDYTALEAYERNRNLNGIGYVLTEDDPFVGWDLDHVLRSGELIDWAAPVINRLDSYTEISPSGEGLRVIVQGALPGSGRMRKFADGSGLEVYDRLRFFTITGNVWRPQDREPRINGNAEIAPLVAELFSDRPERARATFADIDIELCAEAEPPAEKFHALLNRDPKVARTWERTRDDLADPSPSGYCMSLANWAAIAGWSDQEIADLMIAWRRRHGEDLKLDRADWYARTIANARAAINAERAEFGNENESAGEAKHEKPSGGFPSDDEWTEPTPLPARGGMDGAAEYPLERLPRAIREAAAEVARFTFVPAASPAVVGTSITALAIGKKAMVEEWRGLRHHPALFAALIAASGERKSPVFQAMTRPLDRRADAGL